MSTFGAIFIWVVLIGLVADAVHGYVTGTGTVWDKMLAVGKSSASILSARVGMIGGFGLQAIVSLAEVISSPTVKAFVDQYINASAVGYTMIVAAVIAEVARRRTLTVPVLGQSGSEVQ